MLITLPILFAGGNWNFKLKSFFVRTLCWDFILRFLNSDRFFSQKLVWCHFREIRTRDGRMKSANATSVLYCRTHPRSFKVNFRDLIFVALFQTTAIKIESYHIQFWTKNSNLDVFSNDNILKHQLNIIFHIDKNRHI